jgi:uncharacterized protein (DUF2461 family)
VFRLAETEFKLFIEKLTDLFTTVDPQIPALPPKDVIYRIYRDVCLPSLLEAHLTVEIVQVRFSNDKTPYKKSFSATFSRSGRKGIFAGCMSLYASVRSALLINFISFRPHVRSFYPLLCLMQYVLNLVIGSIE